MISQKKMAASTKECTSITGHFKGHVNALVQCKRIAQ
jgi:hypothetical protein